MSSRRMIRVALALAATAIAPNAGAQQPPVRPIGPILVTGRDTMGRVASLRALSDGRILINDIAKKRVLLLDADLRNAIVVADTTRDAARAYGAGGAMVPFYGDSTLLIDGSSLSMLVIDPNGKIARTMALPTPRDKSWLTTPEINDRAGFDGHGGLVYRIPVPPPPRIRGRIYDNSASRSSSDSAFILRVDIISHAVDTVASLKLAGTSDTITTDAAGVSTTTITSNPLAEVDRWTVLSTGTIAMIRGVDFHVDWIEPDGKRSSSPRIPYDWQRLTDSAKVAVVDSLRAEEAAREQTRPGAPPSSVITRRLIVEPSALADYRPAFRAAGGARTAPEADADGNIWIEPIQATKVPGGTVYDIVSREGKLIDRVQLLPGFSIVGFGPGVAYMTSRGSGGVSVLSKVRIR